MASSKKNITFFICSMSSGGAEHQVASLTDSLVERGYDVTITTFGDDKDHYQLNEKIQRVRLADGRSKIVKLISIFWYFLTVRTDAVIIFGQRESVFALPPLCFRRVKVIAGERNFTRGVPSRYERILVNLLYYRADYIVPNSHSQMQHLAESNPKIAGKLLVITNYTDINGFKFCQPPQNKKIRIGIFGRYNPQKNYPKFIEAVYQLKQRGHSNFQIECYGNHHCKGEQKNAYYVQYQELVEQLGVGDIIHLNDHIQDVIEFLPKFDAICLPSLWEGWSNSISEAICCGKPMLVSDVSDNKYMVHDGENGFLFNPESIDDMVTVFEKFFALDSEQIKTMGERSRSIAEQLFDKERFVSAYTQLLE